MANPPSKMAPPTPTTTPMIVRLVPSDKPESPDGPPSPLPSAGVLVMVVTGTRALVVRTCERVLPPVMVTMVVWTSCVALEMEMDVVRAVTDVELGVEGGGGELLSDPGAVVEGAG